MVHTDNEKRGQSERPVWDGQGSGRRSPPAVLIPSPTVDLQPGTGDHGAAAMELGLGRAPAVKAPAATEVGKGERRPGRERGGQGTCLAYRARRRRRVAARLGRRAMERTIKGVLGTGCSSRIRGSTQGGFFPSDSERETSKSWAGASH
jgi:hypothetical protein